MVNYTRKTDRNKNRPCITGVLCKKIRFNYIKPISKLKELIPGQNNV